MRIYSKTDIGKARSTNQDAFIAGELVPDAAFAVVCDGMGGANAGNVASETAVKIISEYIIHSYRANMDGYEIEKMLKNAFESANMEIYDKALNNSELSGMGTTAVAVLVHSGTAVIAHIGDSRAYIADSELTQLTRDHSVVQSLLESGKISAEDAKVHPRKNVITRALGVEESIVSDSMQIPFGEGQTLLLCTDGLSSYAEALDIFEALSSEPKADIPDKLVELALNGGGGDNITAVILSQ